MKRASSELPSKSTMSLINDPTSRTIWQSIIAKTWHQSGRRLNIPTVRLEDPVLVILSWNRKSQPRFLKTDITLPLMIGVLVTMLAIQSLLSLSFPPFASHLLSTLRQHRKNLHDGLLLDPFGHHPLSLTIPGYWLPCPAIPVQERRRRHPDVHGFFRSI